MSSATVAASAAFEEASHNSVVATQGLRKSFGRVEILHGIDMQINPGESRALVGRNGAGKSTLVAHPLAPDHNTEIKAPG